MLLAHCIDWIWGASEPFLYINKQGPQCSNKAPSRWSARVRYACNIFLDLAIMVSARRGANQWILNFLVVLKVIIKRHYLFMLEFCLLLFVQLNVLQPKNIPLPSWCIGALH